VVKAVGSEPRRRTVFRPDLSIGKFPIPEDMATVGREIGAGSEGERRSGSEGGNGSQGAKGSRGGRGLKVVARD